MFKWLTHRSFWSNLLAALVLIVVVWIVFFSSLGFITKHGETIKVPGVVKLDVNAADRTLASQNFEAIVRDSAFVDSLPPLVVLEQTPEAGSVVKPGRTIYLTLNKRVPPMTAMPELVNFSYRSAAMTLSSQRLKVGDTIYKPDIAEDAVLEQLYKGKPIKAGTLIPEGSAITLVLGNGLGNVANAVPDLIGLTYLQARDLLSASNLNVGVVLMSGPVTDTANAYVFKQNPPQKNELGEPNRIRAGASIDLWISQTNPNDSLNVALPQQP